MEEPNPARDAFRQLVREDRIRCIGTEGAHPYEFFATEAAANLLRDLGIDAQAPHAGEHRTRFQGQRRDFGEHTYRLEWEGENGIFETLGGMESLNQAMNGIRVVPISRGALRSATPQR